jgi:hypothetical protein
MWRYVEICGDMWRYVEICGEMWRCGDVKNVFAHLASQGLAI